MIAEIPRQDRIIAEKTDGVWRLEAIGCAALLQRLKTLSAADKNPELWDLPEGDGHVELLLRELILKTRGEWVFPYQEDELCHCRSVPTSVVDRAIMNGSHTALAVSRETSASTGCGTCRPQVERIIEYRKVPSSLLKCGAK